MTKTDDLLAWFALALIATLTLGLLWASLLAGAPPPTKVP